MLATQHLGPFSGGFMVPKACKEPHGLTVEIDTMSGGQSKELRVESGGDGEIRRRTTLLREKNTNNGLDAIQQPEDQESLITVAQKLSQAPIEAGLQQQQHVPPKQDGGRLELAGKEEEANGMSQLRPVEDEPGDNTKTRKYKMELVWTNIIALGILHLSLPVGFYLLFTQQPWKTFAFTVMSIYMSALGITAGAHRLWSHRSYKARWPVQVLFIMLQTLAGQNSVFTWARDHRMHHKYSETDADPHNIERGLFFAHMGWLCCKKHPEVKEKGKQIDMSDLELNPYVMFQHRHFWWMSLVCAMVVPTMIPVLCWGERLWTSFVLSFMVRYLVSLHATWLVNSIAHHHGSRPYDTNIRPCEVTALLYSGIGESSHNYHHTFPFDYAASEMGRYFNLTTIFIDLCADLGLVSGRRRVSAETLLQRRQRTGDLADKEQVNSLILETDDEHQDLEST